MELAEFSDAINICPGCGKQFWNSLNEYGRKLKVFCSIICEKESRKRECRVCGKVFYPTRAILKYSKGIYCSKRCQGIWLCRHSNNKRSDTSIEIAIERELIANKVLYIKQAPIAGIAVVDFLLPNRVIIQCDGDYWHRRPEARKRDIRQGRYLRAAGYRLFRFWEKDINKSASECVEYVLSQIGI